MDQIEEKRNVSYIDIPVLKKGRRALVFLADFFLTLMLTVMLFNLAIYPLGRVVVHYDDRIATLHAEQEKRDSILYGYELLFPSESGKTDYNSFDGNLIYTSESYIHFLVDNTIGPKYEVFRHYFADMKASKNAYVAFYRELDKDHGFFDIGEDSVALKAEYVEEFKPKYNPDDTMSSKGVADYNELENKIFVQGYQRLLADAYNSDLSRDGISYKTQQNAITSILNGNLYLISSCVLLSYFLSWLVFYLIVPLINKSRKTLGMIVLSVIRVKKQNFDIPSLPMSYLHSAYSFVAGAAALVFVPIGVVTFNELFSLPILFVVTVISFAFVLASLAMMLFDAYNRTLGDFFCQAYCLKEEDYDALARKKVSASR